MSEQQTKESKQQLPKIAEILDLPKPPIDNVELANELQNDDLPIQGSNAEDAKSPGDQLPPNLKNGPTTKSSKRDVIKVNTLSKSKDKRPEQSSDAFGQGGRSSLGELQGIWENSVGPQKVTGVPQRSESNQGKHGKPPSSE